jgi:uncharacterized protein YjbJ (UPF0337 family)
MDEQRITGAAKQVVGKIKSATGKVIGDAKLEADGAAEQIAGKIENAAGSLRDAAKPKT